MEIERIFDGLKNIFTVLSRFYSIGIRECLKGKMHPRTGHRESVIDYNYTMLPAPESSLLGVCVTYII